MIFKISIILFSKFKNFFYIQYLTIYIINNITIYIINYIINEIKKFATDVNNYKNLLLLLLVK